MSAYLFVHFTMNDHEDEETIWFSISKDGLNWTDIGGEKPIIKSDIGTRGIRDPFIVYDEGLKKYFIIATDLNTGNGYSWGDAVTIGSRSIYVWESEDLINWSNARLVEVGVENAGCVWAPEAIYCEEKQAWLVFWASCVKEENEAHAKHRIYACFTKDFSSFTPAFKYIEKQKDIIDTDIVYNNGKYYRFSKDETGKCIIVESCNKLIEDEDNRFEKIASPFLDNYEGLEGPEAYYIDEMKKWCLIVDRYRERKGYMPLLCEDLDSGIFEEIPDNLYSMGKRWKRHGGVISISDELADKLIKHFGIY